MVSCYKHPIPVGGQQQQGYVGDEYFFAIAPEFPWIENCLMWLIELTLVNGSVTEGWLSTLLGHSCPNPCMNK